MITYPKTGLTNYPEGSVKELLSISLPLMISMLSANLMLFMGRLFLARFDSHAMNAVVSANILAAVFQDGAIGIACITEIFVGRYNGAKLYNQLGVPVWQMIWFSVITALIFIPVGIWGGPYLLQANQYKAQSLDFFETIMMFGPLFPLVTTLSAFFIGRGKVKFTMLVTILANVINIILDYILIGGVSEIINPMGTKGAALATGCAQSFQAIVFILFFLNAHHRKNFGSNLWTFKPILFFSCLKIGTPNAISSIIELIAWSVLAQMLASVSEAHITVYAIVQSFLMLFTFGVSGLQKGITNISANFMGGGKIDAINKSLTSGIKIIFILVGLFSIPLFLFPELLINLFLNNVEHRLDYDELYQYIKISLCWLWLYFLIDSVSWLYYGVLMAAGDTRFVMLINIVSSWVYSIFPTYLFIVYFKASPLMVWVLAILYALLNTVTFFVRYRNKKWYKLNIYTTS